MTGAFLFGQANIYIKKNTEEERTCGPESFIA